MSPGATQSDPNNSHCSPDFELCAFMWCLQLVLHAEETAHLGLWLNCNQPVPLSHNKLTFQLWIHHQDPAKRLTKCMVVNNWNPQRVYGGSAWEPNSILTDAAAGYLVDNHLHVGVHISSIKESPESRTPSEDVLCNIANFQDSTAFSDIVLKAQRTKVPAHKIMLAAHSPVLEAMLQSDMQEGKASEITLRNMKGPILKDLVASMYGALEEITPEHLLPLFLAADAHQVAVLRYRCLRQILASITTSTVLEYVQVADSVSDDELMNACLKVWAQPDFSSEVIDTPAMLTLMQKKPMLAQKLMLAAVKPTKKRKLSEASSAVG